ncbi:MAG: TerC family protein [Burkholderiaceae bacterium]
MLEWLQTMSWSAVLQIIMIDLLLGGDNAVVIALATRNLNAKHRWQGVLWGTAGAIILRVVLIAFAVTMLKIPFLKLVGGILLFWIGIKLMIPEADDAHDKIEGSDKLWGAIKTIIIADFVMSLDNVIAIAGAAEKADPSHQLGLVIFGLLVSIPIIVFGSQLVLKLMDKYPWIVTAGAALLGWIAGGLLVTDPAVVAQFGTPSTSLVYAAEAAGAIFVVAVGLWLARRAAQSKTAS